MDDNVTNPYNTRKSPCVVALSVILLLIGTACQPSVVFAAKASVKLTPAQKEFVKAVQKNDLERTKALIAEGADVNMDIDGLFPLMLARGPEMIGLLANAGADVNAKSELFKQTVLMFAVNQRKLDRIKALIESGADVTAKDKKSGMTALSTALMTSRPKIEIIKALIDAGADPNDGMLLDNPLLIQAVVIGKTDVIKALIDGGADVNIRNKKGATPLMAAVAARKTEVAKLLIDAGANVNAEASLSGEKKRGGGGRTHTTVMDIGNATGDDELKEMLELEGAKESKKPPELDLEMPNSPRIYSLPCSISGSPPPQGYKFSCSAIDQVAESGTEITTFSMAYFAGKHFVPFEKGKRCQVDLGQPGFYKIRTTTTKTPWELVCRTRLRTTTGAEKWIANIYNKESVISTTERNIVVGGPALKVEKEDKEPVKIKIVYPLNDEQFVFESDGPPLLASNGNMRINMEGGVKLEFEAAAEITGDCDDAATWEMEDVGDRIARAEPDGPSNEVAIFVEGLPEENSGFGEKMLTATACGRSDRVTVKVFFKSVEKNHPGNGSGTTPNWFYYWMQTKAAKDTDGNSVKAEYDPDCSGPSSERAQNGVQRNLAGWFCDINGLPDTIYICEAANSTARVESPWITRRTAGIDTFASTVTHEWQHKLDNDSWWKRLNESFRPLGKIDKTQDWTNYMRMKWVKDSDRDSVPNGKDDFPFDADGEQAGYLDSEDTAYKAEAKWELGAADSEDWSQCGKQWKDSAGCN